MTGWEDALTDDPAGTIIAIDVSAGARKNEFPAGYNPWRRMIGCRVTSPALEGRANRAICETLAEHFDVPASAVRILSGQASSQKKILIAGISRARVREFLGPLE